MLTTSISRFIRKSFFLFAVFMIAQIISVVALEYSFLNYRNQQIEYSTYSHGVASFTVKFKSDTVLSDISKSINSIKDIVPLEIKQSYITMPGESETRAYLFGQFQTILYGYDIKDENDIIISHSDYQNGNTKIGDTVNIGEQAYNVVGVRFFDYAEVSLQSLKNNSIVDKLIIETQKIPTNKEIEEITDALKKEFPLFSVNSPVKRNLLLEYSLDSSALLTFALTAMAMVNISYIFRVVISKRKSYYAVSLCCGASFEKMRFCLIAENLIYGFCAIVIGTCIFMFTLQDMLFPENRFSFLDYFFSVMCCLIVTTIPVFFSMINFSTKSIKELIYNRC